MQLALSRWPVVVSGLMLACGACAAPTGRPGHVAASLPRLVSSQPVPVSHSVTSASLGPTDPALYGSTGTSLGIYLPDGKTWLGVIQVTVPGTGSAEIIAAAARRQRDQWVVILRQVLIDGCRLPQTGAAFTTRAAPRLLPGGVATIVACEDGGTDLQSADAVITATAGDANVIFNETCGITSLRPAGNDLILSRKDLDGDGAAYRPSGVRNYPLDLVAGGISLTNPDQSTTYAQDCQPPDTSSDQ